MNKNLKLLEQVRSGDKDAEAQLVEKNMGLVYSLVRRFTGRGYDVEELSQVGAIGLLKAVKKFDFDFGVQFSTYAVPMIMGEIRRFLRDDGPIKISRGLKETAMKGWRAEERLRSANGREPTITEIAAEAEVAVEELIEAFEATTPPDSLYSDEREDGGQSKLDRLSAIGSENDIINRVLIQGALNSLGKRERQILILRYFKGKTQSEIASLVGVSQVQVSRIEKSTLYALRAQLSE